MRILPTRKMRLDGRHVEPGIQVDVAPEAADLAIRNGWASAQPVAAVEPAPAIEPTPRKRKAKTDA
jgi:hypothetical protein